MSSSRNRIGSISLSGALAGFLFVTFQRWIPLDRVVLFSGLSLNGLLTSFFDASLVGALADWFAVSALFRSPLGIKLPHTDILARNRDAIAEAVPRFLTSFVSEERIASELAAVDFAAKVEKLLGQTTARDEIHDFARKRLSSLVAGIAPADGAAAQGLATFVRELFAFLGERLHPAKSVSSLLRWARREGYDARVIERAAELLETAIERNTPRLAAVIAPIVKRNAGWQGIFVGQGTIERFLHGMRNELARARADPRHELRRMLTSGVDSLAARLAGESADPNGDRDRLSDAVRGALRDEAFQSSCAGFAADLLRRLDADLARNEGGFMGGIQRIEGVLVAQLGSNAAFRQRFNRGVAGLISGLIAKSRIIEGVTGYLSTLLKNTDEREFVDRIEDAVWNDLQYIRVNGAVVGGLVGLILSFLSALARG